LPRRGKGRAVPDRQLIRAEPKGPSLYQRKKGVETYSLSEEECRGGAHASVQAANRDRCTMGMAARLARARGTWLLLKFCEVLPIRSTGTKIFEKY